MLKNIVGHVRAVAPYVRERRKTVKLKQQIRDVQALHRFKEPTNARNRSATLPVLRASARTGVSVGSFRK